MSDTTSQALSVALHALNLIHLSDPTNEIATNAISNINNLLNNGRS